MAHRLVVLEWLYKADQDFGFAEKSLEREDLPYFDQIGFFLHQAVEKYLKAYIVKFDLKFEKQHDLERLLETVIEHDRGLAELREACRLLTPFYFETRYPGAGLVLTREKVEEAINQVRKIQAVIRGKLGIEGEVTKEDLEKENKVVDEILKDSKE